jgi:hypothetical protein
VTLLIGSGADVNIHNSNNETASDLALDNGRLDVARYLSGWMGSAESLDLINLASLERESQDPPPDVARASLGCGNGPNIPDETTSLHAASEMGDLVIMQSLLETGADVNERDEAYTTPLVYAALGGRLEVAKLLIEYGADVNLPEWTGWTPLHAASDTLVSSTCYSTMALIWMQRIRASILHYTSRYMVVPSRLPRHYLCREQMFMCRTS